MMPAPPLFTRAAVYADCAPLARMPFSRASSPRDGRRHAGAAPLPFRADFRLPRRAGTPPHFLIFLFFADSCRLPYSFRHSSSFAPFH